MDKNWIELRDKKTKSLIRIIYNPYHKKPSEVVKDWILPEFQKEVRGVATA
jgi:hypothetical protein